MENIIEYYNRREIHEKKHNTEIQGPWIYEADVIFWNDKDTGFPCLINRSEPDGYLWACVGIDGKHPLYRRNYKYYPTYCGANLLSDFLSDLQNTRIYSKLLPYREYWFYAFDFGHSWDYSPFCDYNSEDYTKYKTVEYAMDKCHSLAKELQEYNPTKDFRGRLKYLKEQIEKLSDDFDDYLEGIEDK